MRLSDCASDRLPRRRVCCCPSPASVALVGQSDAPRWAWYVAVAAAAGATLRARVWDSGGVQELAPGAPYLLTATLLATFVITDRYQAAWYDADRAGSTGPGLGRRRIQPESRLTGELFATDAAAGRFPRRGGIDASVIPVMAFLIGLFGPGCSIGDLHLTPARNPLPLAAISGGGRSALPVGRCDHAHRRSTRRRRRPQGSAGPTQPMAQRGECAASGLLPARRSGCGRPESVGAEPFRSVGAHQGRGSDRRGHRHRCATGSATAERRTRR